MKKERDKKLEKKLKPMKMSLKNQIKLSKNSQKTKNKLLK